MIYLTNDAMDQAVYFDLYDKKLLGRGNDGEDLYFGLLGNGVHEVVVTLKSGHGCVDIIFGRSELFSFVEKEVIRRILSEMVNNQTMH